jgi:hypothetical protein
MDLFATILEVTGVRPPAGRDAVSLVGMAHGRPAPGRTSGAISEFMWKGPTMRSLRRPDEKVVVNVDADTLQLFDLGSDPGERTDVAAARRLQADALKRKLARTDTRAVPGFNLVARGGFAAHRLRVELRADDGFSSVTPLAREDEDTIELSADHRTVTVELHLESGDVDGVRLSMPKFPEAPVTVVSATLDGQPLGTDRVFVGTTRLAADAPMPLVVVPANVVTARADVPPALDGGVRVGLLTVLRSKRPTLAIDPATRQRLDALGYAD